jgi:hypothetical protein
MLHFASWQIYRITWLFRCFWNSWRCSQMSTCFFYSHRIQSSLANPFTYRRICLRFFCQCTDQSPQRAVLEFVLWLGLCLFSNRYTFLWSIKRCSTRWTRNSYFARQVWPKSELQSIAKYEFLVHRVLQRFMDHRNVYLLEKRQSPNQRTNSRTALWGDWSVHWQKKRRHIRR